MSQTSLKQHALPDTKQSIWDLSVIQLTGVTSLPVLAASILILRDHSFLSAFVTIVIGNILLWFIRYGIIAMSREGRKSTLDITWDYAGKIGGYFISFILLVSTLAWYVAQTTLASEALTDLIPIREGPEINLFMQMSVAIGIISTLLCMEGIVVLRWLSSISFPILLIAFIVIIFLSPTPKFTTDHFSISLSGLTLVLGTSLGVTADLPTFFRHSRSWKTSLRAITAIQIISLAIGIGGLFLGTTLNPWLGISETQGFTQLSTALRTFVVILIFFSVINANVSNVYSASVGWELIAPAALVGRKEYLILGLGLTIIFILIANIFSVNFILNATDIALVNLCIVLVVGYIVRILTKRMPGRFEQMTYFIAWLVASFINILQYSEIFLEKIPLLIFGNIIILLVIVPALLLRKKLDRALKFFSN